MKRLGWRLLCPLAVLVALLSGCAPAAEPAAGRTLTVATADDVQSVDPAFAFDTWSTAVVHALTRRLVEYDREGRLVPDLAESWRVEDGGKTYRFRLREARFEDGTPIESQHFRAALERVRDPAVASPGAGFYAAVAAVETPDPRTLVVRLKQPEPTFLYGMGMTFAAPIREGQDPRRPVASGPYRLEAFEPGSRVVLARNPQDTRRTSSLERLVLQLKVDEALQWTRFQAGEVDLLPAIPAAHYASVMADPSQKDNVVQGVVNQTWYFGMNVTRPPWNDARVRRAAFLAIDRRRHVALAGAGRLANGILPPHVPGYDPNRRLPEPDRAQARRLLAEAGYPNGLPPSLRPVMWLAANESYQRHAEAIQADLAAVGIPVELRAVTFSQYLTGYKSGADCWYGGWYPDFPDAGNFLEPVFHGRYAVVSGKSSNASRYRNPEVDQLLDRAHRTPLGPDREALYRQVETILLRDLPWVPLYYEVETRYFRDGVTGVTVHPVWRQILVGIDRAPPQ